MTYAVEILIGVTLVQGYLLWRVVRALEATRRIEGRLAHFGDALSLLAETSEAGFRTVAGEVGRLTQTAPPLVTPRATTRRVASAARRGRSVQEIAATEQMSEGEVQLRLHLANQHTESCPCTRCAGARLNGKTTKAKRTHGSLRA